MTTNDDRKRREQPNDENEATRKRPYAPPAIESEDVFEVYAMGCGGFDGDCPPQS